MTEAIFRNWNNSVLSTPRVVAVPRNLEELIEVVKDKVNYPSPLRVGGSFHSLNACFVSEGTQILLRHFGQIQVDTDEMTVTVGAAVKMFQIRDALKPHGMQTAVTPEIGNATAGSVACCGTKDASLGRSESGQVSSTAIGVRLVNAKGEVETITEARDQDRMRAVRSSYGLFGVIFEITFRIQRLSILSYSYKSFKLTPLPSREELSGGADGILGLLLPYSNRIVVERRVLSGNDAPISRFSRLKHFLRGKLWENGVSFFATLLPYNWFFRIEDKMIGFTLVGISHLGGFRAHRSDSMIDFKFDRGHYFDFTFWAVPVSRWEEFIPEYLAFCQEYLRKTGFRVSLLSEVYFINKDQRALLSFSSEEDVFTVDLTDSRPNDPYWIEFNKRFNVFVARFGARPILNQTKQLNRDIVYQTLGEDWKRFLSYREQDDPDRRFLSKFFEDLI
jgi:hypothetical protein